MPLVAYPIVIYRNKDLSFNIKLNLQKSKFLKIDVKKGDWIKLILDFDLKNEMLYLTINDLLYELDTSQ